ncbi:Activated CDC42 kinase 1 [Oryzias melastigma]|uniref:non-specific protein-tyrosine kinase n=1 Tax=Oryzias melastigma TaxID=30732 RepID=A0A834BYP6_ORYME|nr:Activated CDC42 kinase 1 [Oryzias melastigma]
MCSSVFPRRLLPQKPDCLKDEAFTAATFPPVTFQRIESSMRRFDKLKKTFPFLAHFHVYRRLGGSMQSEEGTEWLLELLMEVQLQQYFLRIQDDLNVTRLSHFDYVKNEDLEKIGMGRPGQRRLWEAVKRRKAMCKRKSWMSKVFSWEATRWRRISSAEPTDLLIS